MAPVEVPVYDPTAWLVDSGFAEFLLMHTPEIRYMCMLGYTYLNGCKLFPKFAEGSSRSYRLVSMVLQCTGGGILIPIFINSIPVPLAQDAYPIAIFTAFLLHEYFPIVRDVVKLSAVLDVALTIMYETVRAYVVFKFTTAASDAIAPSQFSFPVFGPIFCGTISGCGAAFMPLNKGLDPIEKTGLTQPMLSAFIGATCVHLFLSTSLSDGVIHAKDKAHTVLAIFFIQYHLYSSYADLFFAPTKKVEKTPVKSEKAKAEKVESKKKK